MARPYRSQQVLQRSTPTGALPWSSQLRPRIVSCTAPPSASPTDTPTAAVFLAGFIALTAARRLRASSVSRALLVWCSRWSKHLRRSQVLTVTLSRYLSRRHVTVKVSIHFADTFSSKNAFWLGSGLGFDLQAALASTVQADPIGLNRSLGFCALLVAWLRLGFRAQRSPLLSYA